VGQATADALSERGFRHIEVGETNAQTLVHTIESAGYRNVLHLCGDHVRSVDPGSLSIRAITVYQVTDAGDAEGLLNAVHDRPAIMVHSPRAGARLAKLLYFSRRKDVQIIAISRAAADACGEGWAEVTACETPSDAAMLAIVRRICQI
jgi:uroporphyrinogen-III synthase